MKLLFTTLTTLLFFRVAIGCTLHYRQGGDRKTQEFKKFRKEIDVTEFVEAIHRTKEDLWQYRNTKERILLKVELCEESCIKSYVNIIEEQLQELWKDATPEPGMRIDITTKSEWYNEWFKGTIKETRTESDGKVKADCTMDCSIKHRDANEDRQLTLLRKDYEFILLKGDRKSSGETFMCGGLIEKPFRRRLKKGEVVKFKGGNDSKYYKITGFANSNSEKSDITTGTHEYGWPWELTYNLQEFLSEDKKWIMHVEDAKLVPVDLMYRRLEHEWGSDVICLETLRQKAETDFDARAK